MTRRDTRETGPSGRRFGATELPPEIERVVQQAQRLEWATLGVLVVTIVLVAVVMGSSQAMRAAWIEDLLSLIPPIAFLIALRVARMAPTRARPYGSHRSVGVGHLVAAVALSVMGVVLVGDSILGLVTAEHPPIGTFDLFGHTVWQGWFMMAVMALSVPGPMILGHKKLTLAEQLHDRVLYADADMNTADWQTGVATIVGVAGIGLGWWWADAAAAIFVGVSIVLDGWKNLKEAVTNLADRRAATIDGARPHPLIDRAERVARAEPWVRHAGARVRDEGHVFHVEMFVVPHEGADVTMGRCCALRDAIATLDWKLQDVVVAPVDKLPAEVHGGRSGEHQTGEEYPGPQLARNRPSRVAEVMRLTSRCWSAAFSRRACISTASPRRRSAASGPAVAPSSDAESAASWPPGQGKDGVTGPPPRKTDSY